MNIKEASKKFNLMLKFKERISVLERELSDMSKEGYIVPEGIVSLGVQYSCLGSLKIEINKDQLRGQLIRELSDLKDDLRSQAYELGEYFGI